jgi:hypothetical protein
VATILGVGRGAGGRDGEARLERITGASLLRVVGEVGTTVQPAGVGMATDTSCTDCGP